MKCKNCGKEIKDHEKFYIFQYDHYYPNGPDGDLKLVSEDMNEIKSAHYQFRNVWYACGDTIYDAEDGEEITPFTFN